MPLTGCYTAKLMNKNKRNLCSGPIFTIVLSTDPFLIGETCGAVKTESVIFHQRRNRILTRFLVFNWWFGRFQSIKGKRNWKIIC